MNKALSAIVHGRVQGVAFRYYTQNAARELGITGWVRNLPDQTVEVWAEGEEVPLNRFVEWLHKGPPLAIVNRVDLTPGSPKGATTFTIRH